MLAKHHSFKVSREALRKWMQEDGIRLSCGQRRTFHQRRMRRNFYDELIQIDGSDHRWFQSLADPDAHTSAWWSATMERSSLRMPS